MDTKLFFQESAGFQTPMLAVFAVDIATGKDADPLVALLTTSDAVTDAAAKVLASGEFKATLGETLLLHAPGGLKAERLLVVGLGKAKGLSVDEVRKGAGTAVRAAKPLGVRELAIAFPEDHALSDEHLESLPCMLLSRALMEGAELAEMDWDTYRSDHKDRTVRSLTVIANEAEKSKRDEIQEGFEEGLIVAAAQNVKRSLLNEPANVLKPKVKVIGVVCSAENMPDGKAFKPGDVVTGMSGKTIEVVNTDAEGRLVLADGLHYAKTLGCTHLINAATLTGACVVALGILNAGLFTNDEATWEKFRGATRVSGGKFWRLSCTEDYKDQIKSQIADMMNTGKNRCGGAVSGAMVLKEFVGETPWVHLDIAGCAWNDENKPWIANGPSGIGVRSILEWVRAYAQ